MTFTYKLARRLARLRTGATLLLPILAAGCAAGEPFDASDTPIDNGTEGAVALSPRAVTVEGNQGVLFRAFESLIPGSAQVTSLEWTTSGGRIDATGNYSPTSTGTFKVVGRRKGNPHNLPDTSTVIVVPAQPTLVAIDLTPSTATVAGGLQELFAAVGILSDGSQVAIGVTWSTTGGTIDAGGLYTAPLSAGTYKVIATHVTTGLADTATVTVPPATLISITLSPGSVSLSPGQGQQFSVSGRLSDGTTTSTVPVAYAATGGSISVTGYYTAGSIGGTFRVIATAQGGLADTSAVTVTAPALSSVLVNADFESGAWPSGTGLLECASDRIWIYANGSGPSSAPLARQGTRAVRFLTKNTDTCHGDGRARTQAELPRVMKNGGEYWISESLWFPTNTPSTGGKFWQSSEFYSPVAGYAPPVATYVGQGANLGKLEIRGAYNPTCSSTYTCNYVVALLPRPLGVWLNILWHYKVATDQSGYIEAWYSQGANALQPVTFSIPSGGKGTLANSGTRLYQQTMLSGWVTGGMTLIVNNYRAPATDGTGFHLSDGATETVIYYDAVKIGTTEGSVAFSRALLASTP